MNNWVLSLRNRACRQADSGCAVKPSVEKWDGVGCRREKLAKNRKADHSHPWSSSANGNGRNAQLLQAVDDWFLTEWLAAQLGMPYFALIP